MFCCIFMEHRNLVHGFATPKNEHVTMDQEDTYDLWVHSDNYDGDRVANRDLCVMLVLEQVSNLVLNYM